MERKKDIVVGMKERKKGRRQWKKEAFWRIEMNWFS